MPDLFRFAMSHVIASAALPCSPALQARLRARCVPLELTAARTVRAAEWWITWLSVTVLLGFN